MFVYMISFNSLKNPMTYLHFTDEELRLRKICPEDFLPLQALCVLSYPSVGGNNLQLLHSFTQGQSWIG